MDGEPRGGGAKGRRYLTAGTFPRTYANTTKMAITLRNANYSGFVCMYVGITLFVPLCKDIFIAHCFHPPTGEPGMWIGYNDLDIEADWKWTDPYIQSDFNNWGTRSPKMKTSKNRFDCAYQLVTNSGRSRWKDKDCKEQHAFMCKMGAL